MSYDFGTELGQGAFNLDPKSLKELRLQSRENPISIFKKAKKRNPIKYLQLVKEDFNKIGYAISEAGTAKISGTLGGTPVSFEGLAVQEKDLKRKTNQQDMSAGMFRVFSLIVQLNALLIAKAPGCILIDDIGEGLDYSRTKRLVKLLISKAKASDMQLIMASNDQFIMNEIPIEYWSLMHRVGHHVEVYNNENSQKIFKEFAMTGLSNFNFFSSNYFLKKPKKRAKNRSSS